ncbi:MAG: succinylglutamate desuccinylase/aspartoacylase family protein [Candidatus Thorarchaeota archaeon]
MSGRKVTTGIHYEKFIIPPSGTHNTVAPFTSKMIKGEEVAIHAIRINGKNVGPTVYIGGGMHGDEINGVEAILRISRTIDNKNLRGKLILVPVQNPGGYSFRTRLCPYDPIDPDWIHPGRKEGTYSQRMKYILNSLASEADCVIDLHTAGRGGSNNPMIYVPPETGNGAGEKSIELAKAFGGDRIIYGNSEDDYGWPVHLAMPFVAVKEGKMGLYPEAGQGGSYLPEERFVKYFITGVFNVLKKLDMIDGDIESQGEILIQKPLEVKDLNVRVKEGGLFNPIVDVGNMVKKGDKLGEIHHIPKGVHEINAPITGLITWSATYGTISDNGRVFTISPKT